MKSFHFSKTNRGKWWKWLLYNNMEWKRLWSMWNEPTPTTPKTDLHPKKMMCVWWDGKGVLYYEPFWKTKWLIPSIAIRIVQDHVSLWWPGKNGYSLPGKFGFIHCMHLSKHLLISWLQSPSAVILEPPKIKSVTVFTVSPSICHNWWDQMSWS